MEQEKDYTALSAKFFGFVDNFLKSLLVEKNIRTYYPKIVEHNNDYYFAIPFFTKEEVYKQLGWIILTRHEARIKRVYIKHYEKVIEERFLDSKNNTNILNALGECFNAGMETGTKKEDINAIEKTKQTYEETLKVELPEDMLEIYEEEGIASQIEEAIKIEKENGGRIDSEIIFTSKNKLRYVSDDALEVAKKIAEKSEMGILRNGEKIVISGKTMSFCAHNHTTKELKDALEGDGKIDGVDIFGDKNNNLSWKPDRDVGMVCRDCNYEKCPKELAAFILTSKKMGLLDYYLEDREKHKAIIDHSKPQCFEFEWKPKEGLRKISEDIFVFAKELVDKKYIYIDTVTTKEDLVKINSVITCEDCKIINIKNLPNNDGVYRKTIYRSLTETYLRKCNNCICNKNSCAIAVAGYIYYLIKSGRQDLIEEDRKYYNENREEIEKEYSEKNEKEKNAEEKLVEISKDEFEEYNVKNLEVLIGMILNKSQTSLRCLVTGCDKELNDKFIRKIRETLLKVNKIDKSRVLRKSLLDVMAENAYVYSGERKNSDGSLVKDIQGIALRTDRKYVRTQLFDKTLYIINGIGEFINYINARAKDYYENLRTEHVIKLITDLSVDSYIIITGTEQEISSFLALDPRIKFVYQNYKFDINDISFENMYKLFLKKVKVELLEGIQDDEDKFKNKFEDFVSLNKSLMPFTNRELVNYLAMYCNSNNSLELPPDLYKKETIDEALENIVGLKEVKEKIKDFEKYMLFKIKAEAQGLDIASGNMHMLFTGNPGTGKTTVARIMAKLLYDLGIIKENKLIEVERKDLIGRYIGETAPKTAEVIEKAMGGVLFIDEAYSLTSSSSSNDYGAEAIATLIKAMEDRKGEFVVIFAGYKKEMADFVDVNPGIASRIGYSFDFKNYNAEELTQIYCKKLEKSKLKIEDEAKTEVLKIMKYFANVENIGNGRFSDRVYQETLLKHAKNNNEEKLAEITKDDIPTIKEIVKVLNSKNMIDVDRITEEDLRRTAAHEVGHAAVRYFLKKYCGIKVITINAEGTGTLGYVRYDISKEKYTHTKEEYLDDIAQALGGIASEKIYFGSYESGGSSDLERATYIAEFMIKYVGMSKNGLAYIDSVQEKYMAERIYEECNEILEEGFERATRIITEHKAQMDEAVEYLLTKKEITEEELVKILDKDNTKEKTKKKEEDKKE